MTDHRGHYRLLIEGVRDTPYHRDPAQVGSAEGRQPEVRPRPRSADDRAAGLGRYETTVDGWVFEVTVEDELHALLREQAGQGADRSGHHGSDTIRAQLPGRVVRLWVGVGDTVEVGQRLLAIEAMKMENEVRAPRAGTVAAVHVAVDSSVELHGELLTVR